MACPIPARQPLPPEAMVADTLMHEAATDLGASPNAASRMRVNVVANYIGRGWTTIVGLLCLPLFLLLLGREAYGLIGAFAVVQAWALLFDFGLTPTLNREIARARAGARSWQSFADLVRSIEVLAVAVAAVIAVALVVTAPMLATMWLEPRELSPALVAKAIAMMGILAAVRWIEQVYRGAIQGSEDQVWLNLVQAGVETVRWGGALLLIWLVDANVLLFFGWNFVVALASVLILRRRVSGLLRRQAPAAGRLRLAELRGVRRFAGGMFLSALLTFLLTQADKLVLGSYVSLADFGIYTLAATAAAGLLQLVQPMNVAILPRFTALVEARHIPDLTATFHATSQWLAAIVLPVGLLVVVLPENALMAWTGQPSVAVSGAAVLSLLMIASLLNAFANIPYMLQLAHGWTSLTNKINGAVLVVLLPVMIWATRTNGGIGAAAALAGLNLISLAVMSSLVLARLLPGERTRWALNSVLLPTLLGTGVAVALRQILPEPGGRIVAFIQLGAGFVAILLSLLATLPHPRASLLAYVHRRP